MLVRVARNPYSRTVVRRRSHRLHDRPAHHHPAARADSAGGQAARDSARQHFFAICGLLWSAGGLAHATLLAVGLPADSRAVLTTQAVRYSGVGAFPIPVLTIWSPFAAGRWQRAAARVLQAIACISAASVAVLLWATAFSGVDPVPGDSVARFTTYNAAILLMLGALVSLRRRSTPRSVYLPSIVLVSAIAASCLTVAIIRHSSVLHPHLAGAVGGHLVLLVIIAAFLLFARFRYADQFLRHGVRIMLIGTWAGLIALTTQSALILHVARASKSPAAVHIFLIVILTNILLLSFSFVDEWISRHLNRWLFRPPDYRAEARRLAVRMSALHSEDDLAAALEESARGPLELSRAKLVAIDDLESAEWHADLMEGETVELRHRTAGLRCRTAGPDRLRRQYQPRPAGLARRRAARPCDQRSELSAHHRRAVRQPAGRAAPRARSYRAPEPRIRAAPAGHRSRAERPARPGQSALPVQLPEHDRRPDRPRPRSARRT